MSAAAGGLDDISEQKPPLLYNDFFYKIAEHLFSHRDFGSGGQISEIDMRGRNIHTNFMSLCPATRNAVLFQFAKLKRIDFGEDGDIRIFKNEYSDDQQKFEGPFVVNRQFIYECLVRAGLFRSTLFLSYKFLGDISLPEYSGGKTNLQIFCELFLQKILPVANGQQITIDKLYVYESPECIDEKLEYLLAMDAKQLRLVNICYGAHLFIDCLARQMRGNVVAKNTVGITFNFELPFERIRIAAFMQKWRSMVDYCAQCCPNLRRLEFTLYLCFFYPAVHSANRLCDFLHSSAEHVAEMFSQLSAGNLALNVQVGITTLIRRELPLNVFAHPLFRLGDPHELEDMDNTHYIARRVGVTDQAGRSHHFHFCIDNYDR